MNLSESKMNELIDTMVKMMTADIIKEQDRYFSDVLEKNFFERDLFSIKLSRERTLYVKIIGNGDNAHYSFDLFGDRDGFPIMGKWFNDLMSGIEYCMSELEEDCETIWNAFLEYNEKHGRNHGDGADDNR